MTVPQPDHDRITAMLRFGLSRTIQLHSEDFRTNNPGLKLDLDLVDDENLLPDAACRVLFRLYSEAMSNIERHAGAGTVVVRYYVRANQVVLEISDDGKGFSIPGDWAKFTSTRSGVMGMKPRLEALGGELHITSEPEQGTHIQASLPLPV
jgi:signal transduction histidine kinase